MAITVIKRRMRSVIQNAQNWATVIQLTLEGNQVEKRSSLYHAANPILLIYGFGSTRRTLAILERRLQRDGYTVLSLNLGGVFDTFNSNKIEDLAVLIRDKIETLYKRYHFTGKMSIIGHSKGGLIGRYYIQCLGGAERVQHLITLGTPHNGSIWALIASVTPISWVMQSIKQMTPYSALIKSLQKTPFPKSVRMTSIYSENDTVNPYPSAIVDLGPEQPQIQNIGLENIGHTEFLIKKSVYSHIKKALRVCESAKPLLQLIKTA